jgi:hypothetical protein
MPNSLTLALEELVCNRRDACQRRRLDLYACALGRDPHRDPAPPPPLPDPFPPNPNPLLTLPPPDCQISILPFDVIGFLIKTQSVNKLKGLRIVRLLRLMKLVRVAKASRWVPCTSSPACTKPTPVGPSGSTGLPLESTQGHACLALVGSVSCFPPWGHRRAPCTSCYPSHTAPRLLRANPHTHTHTC